MSVAMTARGWLGPLMLAAALCGAAASARAADPAKGQRLYASHCAACHGAEGRAKMPGAPDFNPSQQRLMRPDFTLLASIRSGKNAMPAFQGILTDREILDVIAFLRTLH
jgi:cytochrome c6